MLFAGESLAQALRQLELYGRDGLPVLSADGQHLQGWITSQNVLQAVARHMRAVRAATAQAQRAAGPALPGPRAAAAREAPTPLRDYQILEITIPVGSPAAGTALGDITWPPGWIPVTVMGDRTLRDPDPGITLTPGDRVNLLAREPQNPEPSHPPPHEPASQAGTPQTEDPSHEARRPAPYEDRDQAPGG